MLPKAAELLPLLAGAGVRFIVVGGLAAAAHGSARSTQDVDLVYARDDDNLRRIGELLANYSPYLRGAPPGLPFRFDVPTLKSGLNFTLTTTVGDIDFLGEITGGGGFNDLLPHTEELAMFGTTCLFLKLEKLIEVKRAAGRPRDIEAIAELEALLDER